MQNWQEAIDSGPLYRKLFSFVRIGWIYTAQSLLLEARQKLEEEKRPSSILISLTHYPGFTSIYLAFPLLTLFSPSPFSLHILKASNSNSCSSQ